MKLDDSLGFLINKAAGEMKYAFENSLRPFNLTPGQWSVLSRLTEKEGQTIGAIGKSLYFDKPTISGIIKRLENKGLIVKRRQSEDQRIITIYLTSAAKDLMIELPNLAMAVNTKALKSFDAEETKILKMYLKRILDNMD
ncbi:MULTISPECIES: MarR family winged helix-turn-helix transcriptional regulator [Vibrio]|uniref:MarR family transcriptional regulator n=1 Tax=Vibrio lentus TaxID=136468 RepID=A0A1B9QAI9_9VIBR|nr:MULTISPECIES: MarR family transcriptional regulator [Vibrio]OCH56928.1 MarR family transcriptional regulator [Vibrio lentus]PME46626.1 MarR family transcriptional regulator [Vibrio lentus]PME56959.1 MarR family transcriptional regulator [Vibrio lentus]PME82739.1 MarR family transcriptional regulator [Vibrio lentus]PMH91257.1 MarR family transcriptional regulator [Vibrio lentus]